MKKPEFNATRTDMYRMAPEDVILIGLDTKDGPSHPLYDPRVKFPPNETTVEDMLDRGVVMPVVVRKNGSKLVEVVEGRQRVINARAANVILKKRKQDPIEIKVIFERDDDEGLFETSIAMNEHRREDDMVTKAEKAKRLLKMGRSEEKIAVIMNCSVQMVKMFTKILDLTPGVQAAIRRGQIAASSAVSLARLPREEQDRALEQLALEEGTVSSSPHAKSGRITAEKARRAVSMGQSSYTLPKKRQLNRLIEEFDAGKHKELDDLVIKVIRCLIIGNLDPRGIKGMTEALRATEKKPVTKKEPSKGGDAAEEEVEDVSEDAVEEEEASDQ